MKLSAEASQLAHPAGLAGGPIVVGYDGSASSACAVKYAAGQARRERRPLHLLTIDPASRRGHRRRAAPDDLVPCRLVASTRLHYPDLVVRTERVEGDPVEALVSRSADGAMLVLGCRGLDQLGRLVRGSTSVAVTGRARGPVVVVPSGWPGWQPRSAYAAPLVVGIDPAQDGPELLDFAFGQAASRGVGVLVLSAVAPGPGVERDAATRRAAVQTGLDALLRRCAVDFPGIPVRTAEVVGYPVPSLLRAALGAPLLVLGRHHSGRVGFRIGSVAREVLHRAEVPVAVVPLA